MSDESGQNEVYVQPFPGPGPKRQISTGGGEEPTWSHSGRELFYRLGGRMMAVPVRSEADIVAERPKLLSSGYHAISVEASRRMAITCQPSAHSLCSAAPIRRHPSGLLRPRLATNLGPRAHLQIGRAYAMQGDTAKVKPAYQDFLRLWKDADPDIPILIREKRNTRSCHNL